MRSKAHDEPARSTPAPSFWQRAAFTDEQLAEGLVAGAIAGPVISHDRRNVLWKIDRLVSGDPDLQFGLTGVDRMEPERVLALMADAAGFDPSPEVRDGPVDVDPWRVLPRLVAAGDRLAQAAERGERVLLATGHPHGLIRLYAAVGELLTTHGGRLLRPRDGYSWRELGVRRRIRYVDGVATFGLRTMSMHTHSPVPMQHLLEAETPDLVFADHGFAGAAIEAGIDAVSIADVNDPAPVVAAEQGRTRIVIVMDDNVHPDDYWPCFQAIASRFPP
jgi:hypothetical protein